MDPQRTARQRAAVTSAAGLSGLRVDPTATSQGLVRHRLVDALEPSPGVRICLLSGLQGSGKTTALAHWAAATSSAVVVLSPGREQGETAAGAMVADALWRGATVLALDDADQHPACVLAMQRALAEAPGLRLVLTGRTLPAIDLARGEVDTEMVPGDVLRFRDHEVSALFRDEYGAPLAAPDAARLAAHTDGWAAALRLFRDSVTNSTPVERQRAVSALGRRATFARHYLHHQALAGLPPDVVAVLRRCSALESLTTARCRELLGRDVRNELRGLDRCTLVTSPDAGMTRVAHPLLRAHLLTDLRDELGDGAVDALLRRAARLHLVDDEIGAAARTLATARAWQELEDLVRTAGPRLWSSRDVAWGGIL